MSLAGNPIYHRMCAVWFCLLFPFSLVATSSAVDLVVRVPREGEVIDAAYIRFAGSTDPAAELSVNNQAVRVYAPSGSFAGRVPLRHGKNVIQFEARTRTGRKTVERTVIRPTPPTPLPASPVRILLSSLRPQENIWLMADDWFDIRFSGSPGCTGRWSIHGIASNLPLFEAPAGSGEYTGQYLVRPCDAVEHATVTVEIERGGERTSALLTGTFSAGVPQRPLMLTVRTERQVPLLSAVTGWTRLGYAPANSTLLATGRSGGRYRVRLAAGLSAWVSADDVVLSTTATVQRPLLERASIRAATNQTEILFELPGPVPYAIGQPGERGVVTVDLFGADVNLSWAQRPSREAGLLRHLAAAPFRDGQVRVTILSQAERFWGVGAEWRPAGLVVRLLHTPELAPTRSKPLVGLLVAIDAGHGGRNIGAESPSGRTERAVNLAYAERVAERLAERGAQTVMVRTKLDEDVALVERIERAERAGAHVFLSCHCNSVGLSADPLAVRGVSTYSNWPLAHALADAVYEKLVDDVGLPEYGRISPFDFAPIRTQFMPAILVEAGFLTHPEEEQILISPEGQKKIAKAIVAGVEAFAERTCVPAR